LIDPGAEAEKERWPGENPVPGDHDDTCEKHARSREPVEVILSPPCLWDSKRRLERVVAWVVVVSHVEKVI